MASSTVAQRKRTRQSMKLMDEKKVKVGRGENFIKRIINGDQTAKTSSFLKRKPTLLKKARELQILCDVKVCVVSFGADGVIDSWPENQTEVMDLIKDYKGTAEKDKDESSILGFLEAKKKKLEKQILKERKKRLDEFVARLDKWVDGLSSENAVMGAVAFLESKVDSFKEKIRLLEIERKGKVTVGDGDDKQIDKLGSSSSGLIDHDTIDWLMELFDDKKTEEDYNSLSMDDAFDYNDWITNFCTSSSENNTANSPGSNLLSMAIPDTNPNYATPESIGLLGAETYNTNPNYATPESIGLLSAETYNHNPLPMAVTDGNVLLNNYFLSGSGWMNTATPMGRFGITGEVNGHNNLPINGNQIASPLHEATDGNVLLNNDLLEGFGWMNTATPMGRFGITGEINGHSDVSIYGHQITSPLHEVVPVSTWFQQF